MADIVVTENIAGEEMDALTRAFDISVDPQLWKSPEKLHAAVGNARAIIVRNQTKVDRELIASAKRLEVIGRAGVGLDNVDVKAASNAGVVVAFTPEQNAISVAELTIGLMLSLARMIPAADASTKAGKWERQTFTGTELFGKTLGLIGLGRIGFLVATRARAFGMKTLAHDTFVSSDSVRVSESGATLVSMDELLSQADIISVHVPGTPQTEKLIGADKFARMKKNALFINTSRGEVVDEAALIAALREKRIAGAALDVRATEPPTAGELESMPDVILLPHIAAFTIEGQKRVVTSICRDVTAVLRGQPAKNFVNFPRPRRG
ncbi:MAG: D-3-phosphoglycerate dehydrogenase / 2-oxoglutarate reductase [Phycisphaerales bacterium]|jgi:D-3-phosphoglycerate dehydrogenase|nr:D-3-phosphoglycerate dehydrogenase / 2-oxoglutarate reductase [Phycisphaerales bacterium]